MNVLKFLRVKFLLLTSWTRSLDYLPILGEHFTISVLPIWDKISSEMQQMACTNLLIWITLFYLYIRLCIFCMSILFTEKLWFYAKIMMTIQIWLNLMAISVHLQIDTKLVLIICRNILRVQPLDLHHF